jgi:hypothetical protein
MFTNLAAMVRITTPHLIRALVVAVLVLQEMARQVTTTALVPAEDWEVMETTDPTIPPTVPAVEAEMQAATLLPETVYFQAEVVAAHRTLIIDKVVMVPMVYWNCTLVFRV